MVPTGGGSDHDSTHSHCVPGDRIDATDRHARPTYVVTLMLVIVMTKVHPTVCADADKHADHRRVDSDDNGNE